MRYANYRFKAKGVNNLGDNLQILAIDYIYSKMGIDLSDVIYIDTDELKNYCGEYVILPVTMPLVDYQEGGIAGRFSEHIIPVFLGLTMVKDTLAEKEIEYLKSFSPVGCRDERTLSTMRKYGIESYLHGCLTVTLPEREKAPLNGKVYIVDVSDDYIDVIPKELRENAVFRTHIRKEKLEDPKEVMRKLYDEYKGNASLVITSLLHCSVPCLAAGIPVILIKHAVSYRMAWLEKLLPIYTPDRFSEIEWSPKKIELDEHRKKVCELTERRLFETKKKFEAMLDLSWFYENRPKSEYINDACYSIKKFIDSEWTDKSFEYDYSVWGLTQISEWVVDYISANYPAAKLRHAYDSARKLSFYGLESESPENIVNSPDETVFVTTNGAENAAHELFEKIGKKEGTFAFVKVVR